MDRITNGVVKNAESIEILANKTHLLLNALFEINKANHCLTVVLEKFIDFVYGNFASLVQYCQAFIFFSHHFRIPNSFF